MACFKSVSLIPSFSCLAISRIVIARRKQFFQRNFVKPRRFAEIRVRGRQRKTRPRLRAQDNSFIRVVFWREIEMRG